jgi:hypothetical protein
LAYFPFPLQHTLTGFILSTLGKCFYVFLKKHYPTSLKPNEIASPSAEDIAFWWSRFKTLEVSQDHLGPSCSISKILGRLLQLRHTHVNNLRQIKALCFPSVFIDAIQLADYLVGEKLSQELKDVEELVKEVAEYMSSKYHEERLGGQTSHSPIPIHVLVPLACWLGVPRVDISANIPAPQQASVAASHFSTPLLLPQPFGEPKQPTPASYPEDLEFRCLLDAQIEPLRTKTANLQREKTAMQTQSAELSSIPKESLRVSQCQSQ